MHDNIITSYQVDLTEKTLILHSYNPYNNQTESFLASGVLTHSFENILPNSIILCVEDLAIEAFIKDNREELEAKKQYCWPIYFEDIQSLQLFLIRNSYRYIRISSSYGLCGWILAKNFKNSPL